MSIIKAEDTGASEFANISQIPGLKELFSKKITENFFLKVGDKKTKIIMSPSDTVRPSEKKARVLDKLLDVKRKRDASIYVESMNGFLGIITPHSFLRKRESAENAEALMAKIPRLKKDDTIEQALKMLAGQAGEGAKFVGSTLPVVDEKDKLHGIVSEADIMRPVLEYILKRDTTQLLRKSLEVLNYVIAT